MIHNLTQISYRTIPLTITLYHPRDKQANRDFTHSTLQLAAAENVFRIDSNVELLQDFEALKLGLRRSDAETPSRGDVLLETIEGLAASEDNAVFVDGDARGDVVIV